MRTKVVRGINLILVSLYGSWLLAMLSMFLRVADSSPTSKAIDGN